MTNFENWLKETYKLDITTLSWNDYVKYTKEFDGYNNLPPDVQNQMNWVKKETQTNSNNA